MGLAHPAKQEPGEPIKSCLVIASVALCLSAGLCGLGPSDAHL